MGWCRLTVAVSKKRQDSEESKPAQPQHANKTGKAKNLPFGDKKTKKQRQKQKRKKRPAAQPLSVFQAMSAGRSKSTASNAPWGAKAPNTVAAPETPPQPRSLLEIQVCHPPRYAKLTIGHWNGVRCSARKASSRSKLGRPAPGKGLRGGLP